jgi:DNA polymerase-4
VGTRTGTIFHVDLDAFYASVEQRDNPTLKGRAVIVGATPGHRGVVSACSYEARKFGVHSAMPISEAYRRCPKGVFLPVRMARYIEVSRRIMRMLADYTPEMQQISVDEAFLDLSGTERLFGPAVEVGRRMKQEVWDAERLTLSIGIAANRYLAKLASEFDKPDGLYQVAEGAEGEFLQALELKDLWGLGKKMLHHLNGIGIETVADLRRLEEKELIRLMGDGAGRFLYRSCHGIDPGIHSPRRRSHSMSHEITFERDTADREHLRTVLLELAQLVMNRLHSGDWEGSTVFVKVRTQDFKTTSAQTNLGRPPASTEEIHKVAMALLEKRWDGRMPIRLIGVGISGDADGVTAHQGELFEADDERRRRVEKAILDLSRKSKARITRASLLKKGGRRGLRATE